MPRRTLSALVAATALALGGCGGGDDDDQDPAASYREEANALCADAREELEKLGEPRTREQVESFFDRAIDLGREYDARYEKLEPPAKLRDLHREAVKLSERGTALSEELAEAIEGEPDRAALSGLLDRFGKLVDRSNANARRQGLDECVEDDPLAQPPPEETS